MIQRTLVPTNVRPPSPDDLKRPVKRTTTYMDDRTVVPSELSEAPPLDGKSSIPSYLPLDVLVNRTLVPRGLPAKPLEKLEEAARYSIAIMDERTVVPAYVEPPVEDLLKEFDKLPEMTPELREVVEPDIFLTGDANLLVATEPKHNAKYDATVRTASLVVHILLVIFLVFSPKIFPYHPPSQADLDLARNALNFVYLPPETSVPAPPRPQLHISPRVLNKIAPPVLSSPIAPPAETAPVKPTPAPDLPSAPVPHVPVNPNPTPAPRRDTPATPPPSDIQPIKPEPANPGHYNLNLPSSSPNKDLRDQLSDAIRRQGSGGIIPSPGSGFPRGGGGGGGGGQRGPGLGSGVQMLTPTDGVDFNSYIQRLLATVKRNWFSVMPESAYLGEKGIVSITFKINQDGSVPAPDPILERTSGREPLDNAAMSSIRMSNPFEPLPSAYKRPFIELRFIYFYNLPVDTPF
jgi:outer membrane biosynthesis protein TonB